MDSDGGLGRYVDFEDIEPDLQDPFITAVRITVSLLVRGEYDTLASATGDRNFSAEDLERMVRQYGHELIHLPEEAWSKMDIVHAPGEPTIFNVDIPLWTSDEGESDLTLQLHS